MIKLKWKIERIECNSSEGSVATDCERESNGRRGRGKTENIDIEGIA